MFLKIQVFFFILECLGPSYKNEIPECFYILQKFLGRNSEHFLSSASVFSSMIWFGTDFQALFLFSAVWLRTEFRVFSARQTEFRRN